MQVWALSPGSGENSWAGPRDTFPNPLCSRAHSRIPGREWVQPLHPLTETKPAPRGAPTHRGTPRPPTRTTAVAGTAAEATRAATPAPSETPGPSRCGGRLASELRLRSAPAPPRLDRRRPTHSVSGRPASSAQPSPRTPRAAPATPPRPQPTPSPILRPDPGRQSPSAPAPGSRELGGPHGRNRPLGGRTCLGGKGIPGTGPPSSPPGLREPHTCRSGGWEWVQTLGKGL